MFFSKSKEKDNEILPPPPPFPAMEFDESDIGDTAEVLGPRISTDMQSQNPDIEEQQEIFKDFEDIAEQKFHSNEEKVAHKKSKVKESKSNKKREAAKAKKEAKIFAVELPAAQINDFKSLHLEDARQEIRDAILKIKEKEKPSFLKSLFSRRQDASHNRNVDLLNEKIAAAKERLFRNDGEGAKMIYLDIMRLYKKCGKTEQAKVYSSIKELYDERKKAEQVIAA